MSTHYANVTRSQSDEPYACQLFNKLHLLKGESRLVSYYTEDGKKKYREEATEYGKYLIYTRWDRWDADCNKPEYAIVDDEILVQSIIDTVYEESTVRRIQFKEATTQQHHHHLRTTTSE